MSSHHGHSHGGDGDEGSHGHSQNHAPSNGSPTSTTAPVRRMQTKSAERWMSFSWFVGLHIPILYTLLTGNTTLARSIWPASFFQKLDEVDGDPNAPPSNDHPQPHAVWYPLTFFLLLTVTFIMYFTAAFSYPGFVDEEYKKRKSLDGEIIMNGRAINSDSNHQHQRPSSGRNGYSQVNAEESKSSNETSNDVRIDIHPNQIRRIVVDDADTLLAQHQQQVSSPSIPASIVGEAEEAAELSIGCAPPIPMLQTLGLSKAQTHAADQTATDPMDRIADQTVEVSDEFERLTPARQESSESQLADIELGPMNRNGQTHPASGTTIAASSSIRPHPSPSSPQRSSNPLGYCQMCRLVRPARAKHCYKCRHCVIKFDHHCPFVANCIGVNNHRWFVLYLWCQMTTMIWGITLNSEPYLYRYTTASFYGHAVIMGIMLCQLMVSSMLCMFHTWLAFTNQTTYQVIQMQDASLSQTPQALTARRMQRRHKNRQMGEHSSDEDDEEVTAANTPLTWSTYHVGFFRNLWTFFRGELPDEHLLPRSILEQGKWTHLPHALEVFEVIPSSNTPQRPVVPTAAQVESTHADAVNSTLVNLSYGGRPLPTTAAEVASFPETPPNTEPTEAYTRPTRILGHAKLKSSISSSSTTGNRTTELIAVPDEDPQMESVRL